MNNLLKVFLFGLTMLVYVSCNNSGLKERVQITEGVSVLMPKEYKKNDIGDGNVMVRSRMGTTDLRVVAIKDPGLDGLSTDKMKEALDFNVAEFLKPMKGKLLHRKDTMVGNVMISDFEMELGTGDLLKQGKGRFLLKGNKFITFMLVTPAKEIKSAGSLQESFLNSIKFD